MDITSQVYAVNGPKHESFPISDFKEGLLLNKEPWLSNSAAFRRLDNARIFRGQIVKRKGISFFAEIGDTGGNASVNAVGTTIISGRLYAVYDTTGLKTDRPVANSVQFTADSGTAHANIHATLANMRWVTTIPITGATESCWVWDVIDNHNKVIGVAKLSPVQPPVAQRWRAWVCWADHTDYVVSPLTPTEVSYTPNPETEIVGAYRFSVEDTDHFIVCDPDYVYAYDLTSKFYKIQGFAATGFSGPFTGSNTDYFWFWPVDDYVVMTNNKDPVCRWVPSLADAVSIVEMDTDWVTPGVNELDTCLLVINYKGRLIYFNTVEGSTRYGTRGRWTDAGSPSAWRDPNDFQDAPLYLGNIVSGDLCGDRIFIAFENGWMEFVHRPGDSKQAFEWRPIQSRFGAVSKLSTIADADRLLSRSVTSMQRVDPNGQTYLDIPIPDLVKDFSVRHSDLCAGFRSELERSFYWTYVSISASKPDGILCAVYDENNELSWSQYTMRMNVFSTFDKQGAITWNQLGPNTLNSYAGQSLNSLGAGAIGTSKPIGGQSYGTLYTLGEANTDYYITGIERIAMVLESQKLFPFAGQRAHFGWMDFLLEVSAPVDLKISFYADEKETPYKVKTFTATPSASSAKVYHRISVGRTATFHKFKIETLDDQALAIDALVPWFRPAGRIRKF